MPRPGVTVTLRDTPGGVGFPTTTGTWFVAGTADRGPAGTYSQITDLNDFVNTYGQRQSYSVLYDAIETFFREGGGQAYVSRVCGPAATSGFLNLMDNAAAVSLVATAIGPGAWSSSYKVAVVTGVTPGTYRIQVTDASNNVLEDSGDLIDQNAAVYWSRWSNYIHITLGASTLVPIVVAATAMSAGNDDRVNITDTQWQNSLAVFSSNLGPGQVSQPGRTTSVAYNQVLAHAASFNRVGILDLPNTPTVATLQASAASVTSRFGAAFAPWLIVPGVTSGTIRTVPPSALIAGLCARNDDWLGANRPAAGAVGQVNFTVDLSQPDWDDTSRGTLNNSSVNVIRRMLGGIRVYGWRALVNPNTDTNWLDFANGRLYMQLSAELSNAGEIFMFNEIDGQNGSTINGFHDACVSVLNAHYLRGELFGDTAEDAFSVDTGPSVNTLDRLMNLELHAVVNVKMAPMAEWVQIEVVKRRLTESL